MLDAKTVIEGAGGRLRWSDPTDTTDRPALNNREGVGLIECNASDSAENPKVAILNALVRETERRVRAEYVEIECPECHGFGTTSNFVIAGIWQGRPKCLLCFGDGKMYRRGA